MAVVTGVSRRAGIGFAIAKRLLDDGASVLIQSWSAHDERQPWGADPGGMGAVIEGLGGWGLAWLTLRRTSPRRTPRGA